jgi:hypothetical protein
MFAAGAALAATIGGGVGVGVGVGAAEAIEHMGGDCPELPAASVLDAMHDQLVVGHNRRNPRDLAHELGVELTKTPPPIDEIAQSRTPAQATEVVSVFTQESFGFPVRLEYDGSKMNLEAYKAQLTYFSVGTSLLPVALVRAAAVEEIVITNLSEKKYKRGDDHVVTADMAMVGGHKIQLDANYVGDPRTVTHEILGHALQASACSGLRSDSAYTSFNPEGYAYKGDPAKSTHTVSDTIVGTSYAEKNEHEDFAEAAAQLATRSEAAQKAISNDTPWSHKVNVVAERFNSIVPNSPKYFSSIRRSTTGLEARAASSLERQPVYTPELGLM